MLTKDEVEIIKEAQHSCRVKKNTIECYHVACPFIDRLARRMENQYVICELCFRWLGLNWETAKKTDFRLERYYHPCFLLPHDELKERFWKTPKEGRKE